MIEELATVIAVDGQKVTVTSDVKSACSGCQQVDQCGSGQVAKALPQRKLTSICHTEQAVKLGDKVIIGILEKPLLMTAWQVYLLPILGLLSFAAFGQWVSDYFSFKLEIISIVFGVVGGYLGFKLAQSLQKRKGKAKQLEVKLLKVL